MINVISAVFLILILFSSRMILLNNKITVIEVSEPIICGDFCNGCDDISLFQVDTILFGKAGIESSNSLISDAVSSLMHSDNLNKGLIFKLESASYSEYIELLDAMLRNRIDNYKLDNDCVYLFPNKKPKQIEFFQRCQINSKSLNLREI
jgi:hypothetical protein